MFGLPRARTIAALVLIPASIAAKVAGAEVATFALSGAAVIPLAGVLGQATEELAIHAGPRVGGLLNATMGNAAELIIGVLLVARGEIAVVRASITGSILGNLLLVLGAAFLAGGLKAKELRFSPQSASTHVVSLTLAVAGVMMPTVIEHSTSSNHFRIESISVGVAVVLIAMYAASLVFALVTHNDPVRESSTPAAAEEVAEWSARFAVSVLVAVAVLVALESELLVGALQHTVERFDLSPIWVGLILVPIIGNAAEHSTAVLVARKGKADLALDIAVGSSSQVALLVAPLLVFAGLAFGHDLTLAFSVVELAAMIVAILVVAIIALDGRSNWLEGSQLLGLYTILAIGTFFVGKP
jgi:Ca2+:H+ antiporter